MTKAKVWTPGDPVPPDYVMAKDNLPARDQGGWAQDKLRWLEEFLRPAIAATKRKGGATYYVDLFAGPGRNANDRGDDFQGSPLIGLESEFLFKDETETSGFNHFYFCNIDPLDHALLEQRVEKKLAEVGSRVKPDNVRCLPGDSNELIHKILDEIPEWAYVMVVADIDGPSDLAFDTLRALRQRHDSVDLYVLYPTNLGISRLLPYDGERRHNKTLDRYFPTLDWEEIVNDRRTNAQSAEMRGRLLELYRSHLANHWKYVEVAMDVRKKGGNLYHMLFATDFSPAISMAISARSRSGQYGLFDSAR
ncbi:MAG: three-Cys-motif partner protein TcmP [Acidimicrobiia bacterium]